MFHGRHLTGCSKGEGVAKGIYNSRSPKIVVNESDYMYYYSYSTILSLYAPSAYGTSIDSISPNGMIAP